MRLWLAFRSFFAVLFSSQVAQRVQKAMDNVSAVAKREPDLEQPAQLPKTAQPQAPAPKAPVRNDAVTLLATLQRDARFLDIVQEPLDSYSDAQIGAAARDVLRNCAVVVERLFAPQPAVMQDDGSDIDVPHGYDPMRYRLVGNVTGNPPFRGKLTHHGWLATRCELPAFSGNEAAANVIAPIEVEVA